MLALSQRANAATLAGAMAAREFTFHDASGSQVTQPWKATTTFSMSC